MTIAPPLTDVERAAYQVLLTEANAAYHALLTGAKVTKFRDQNGEEITYSATSINKLAAYIEELKRVLGQLACGTGPMRVFF